MTTLTANEVFRDYETDGVPASGAHKPVKADIREYLTGRVENPPPIDGGIAVFSTSAGMAAFNSGTAYLTEPSREGEFIFDASDLSAEVAIDTGEDRYVAPLSDTTGASGAWVRAGSVATGSFWETETPPARVHRLADRLMVGDASANDGGPSGAGVGSWLYQQGAGASKMSWIERNAVIAGVGSDGTIGVTGAARNVGADGAVIGTIGYAVNYGSVDQTAWGSYIEGLRGGALNGTAWGIEVDVTNLAVSPAGTAPYDPYGAAGATYKGTTIGIGIMAGGDPVVNPVVFDNDVAINIGSNGAKWLSGLVFGWNALYPAGGVSGARAHAVSLAPNYALDWYGDSTHQSIAFSIASDITDNTSVKEEIRASSDGVAFYNTVNGKRMFKADFVTSAVNYIRAIPAATGARVSFRADGDDTNVTFAIESKGSGSVYLGGTGGNNGLQVFADPSAVNWFLVRGEPTGTSPSIAATGAGTNLDVILTPKGTGNVRTAGGVKSTNGTNGVGYDTGAGGAVTQATSKTTGVTLSKVSGQITTNNASLAATTTAIFTVTNTTVAATDVVNVSIGSGGTAGAYQVWVAATAAGSFNIAVRNITAGALGEAVVINFAVIKAVAA